MKAETTRGKFSNPKPDLVKEVMETTKEAPIGGYGIGSNAPLKYAAIKAQISKPSKINEIVIPLKPLENLELSNVEKGLKDSTSSVNGYGEDTDNKRESQASSGSWPSWIYTYYTRAYDSYTMKSTSSKRNGDTISSSADNSNSLSSVAGAGVGNPAIAPVAAKFREIKYGSLIISACIIVSSIPPIPGGFAYGFPMGFLPVYPAALIGASLSFFICRLLCLGRATKMAEKQGNFYKLSLAIEEGGFWVIFLIRLSPFPFTYSNAFFAAVQSVSFTKFFIVTAITLPKILIHIFIGSRLHNLADEMDPTSRIVNYVSLGVGILFLFVATYIIYNKMNKVVEKAAAKRFLEKGDVESAFETDNEDDGSILYVGDETVVEEDISHHYYKNELNLA
ncbi:14048_t:CDS:2 [Entrophospora sp. SA101]|nr:14048_t:CDS:2 [Entrophospora sp. SA101]